MPLKRLCKCGKSINYNEKYCFECSVKIAESKRKNNRYYDNYMRDKEVTDFYHSSEWITVRQDVINYFNGLDIYCLLVENRIAPADVVHHIIPLKKNKSLSLSKSNLIPLSSGTHNCIEALYKKSDKDKAMMQDQLFQLLILYKNKYKVGK